MVSNRTEEQDLLAPPARRWTIVFARAGWLFIILLLTAIFMASIPSAGLAERQGWQFAQAIPVVRPYLSTYAFATLVIAARYAVVAIFYAVALLIAARKWDDWFALFVSAALLLVIWGFGARADTSTYAFPGPLMPFEPALTVLLQAAFLLSWVLLFFLLPDGRFVPRRARWLALLILPGIVLTLFSDSEYTVIPWRYRGQFAEIAWRALLVGLLASIIAGLITQAYRYRHVATPTQRQQMKWILVGLAAQPLPLLFGFSGLEGTWGAVWAIVFPLFIVTLLPVTIGLAVFRRRLWDVDPLINRTLVYGGLTLLILFLYVTLVGLAVVLFGETSNLILAALAVGVAALLAQPIRTWLQRGVNRLMYGDRDDPATVLTRLGDQLAIAAAPAEALQQLVESVAQALKLPYVAIESSEASAILAETGRPESSPVRAPLIYQSIPVGELLVSPRAPDKSFTVAERRLLDDIARPAGAAVYSAQLTAHLQHSREQLVLAREEERRRLQRDLHDGLGPQLAALGMQLEVARGLVADSTEAADLLARLSTDAQNAIGDIRRLVYELRPPALDQLGLTDALREYVGGPKTGSNGLLVTVETQEPLPPLPAAVEVAAYRIAQEAVANCRQHAAASTCRITLAVANHVLRLDIQDDGRGLPSKVIPGVGLASMRERASELGGACRIESAPGRGVHVTAVFPLMERE